MLRERAVERTKAARASGHLESIPTVCHLVERHGVRWVIRMADGMVERKTTATTPSRNPFLPPEPELLVADLGETHRCLLNKFNVVDHHLVIVTRRFEHQRSLLTAADFEATSRCLAEIGGLAFYNAGRPAGASQPHKHVQLLPRVDPDLEGVPIAPLLDRLPFLCAHAAVSEADDLERTYRSLMDTLGSDPRIASAVEVERAEPEIEGPGERQAFPYDLLLTPRWMLIVPRLRASAFGIQINSLGYAGAFLAKTEEDRRLIEADPLAVLAEAAVR